jgi:hypothetical protein
MEETIHNKKYSKSLHGYQCVGPCYKKNNKIIHPIYFNVVQNTRDDFCPTNEWIYENNTGNIQRFYIDECNINNNNKFQNFYDLLYPYTNFDELVFLDSFYNINDFNQTFEWIENNKNLSINTKQRIFDLSLKVFKNNFDIFNFNDTRLVDFIIDLIKNKYFDSFSIEFFKYITIKNEKVSIEMNENYKYDKETNENIIIKQNFILKHILTIENITNFINIYFRKIESNDEMDIIKYPSEILIDKLILFIIGNIKKTFIK